MNRRPVDATPASNGTADTCDRSDHDGPYVIKFLLSLKSLLSLQPSQ